MSIARQALSCSGLFEAELLLELMLRYWNHPLADDAGFRSDLLENAVGALRMAANGEELIEGLPGPDMNLVAAVWYAEWDLLQSATESTHQDKDARSQWLTTVRVAVPSCFCGQDRLM